MKAYEFNQVPQLWYISRFNPYLPADLVDERFWHDGRVVGAFAKYAAYGVRHLVNANDEIVVEFRFELKIKNDTKTNVTRYEWSQPMQLTSFQY